LTRAVAQYESTVMEGEFGISAGAAHYFGDLNTKAAINRPKPAIGLFFRKQFGNYIGMRISGHYLQLGYSDIYNTNNEFQKRRNLSFNTNVFEIALQGDFNFFKFVPGDPYHRFTPYVTLGVMIPMPITGVRRSPFAVWERKDRVMPPIPTVSLMEVWAFAFPSESGRSIPLIPE